MKNLLLTLGLGSLCALIVLPAASFAGEETFEGLKLVTDNGGRITAMSVSNPESYLGIEAEYAYSVNADGTPTSGTVTFKNNVQRQMKPGELTLHFEQSGGQVAVWDYYGKHGKTTSYTLASDKLPSDVFGKTARLILNDGKQYVGKLAKLAGMGEGYSLTVEGACCGPLQFTNNTVKEIQVMK
ncbi:MAG TPA: hypothetical protein VKF42_04445 [Chitinivibrionales bacterium]|nr:hypothetical protein [Chitinivibrionales bacterium]